MGTHRHKWVRDEKGRVDTFAMDWEDFHNGTYCVSCGDSFCEHCAVNRNKGDYLKRFNEMTCSVDNGLDDKPYTMEDFK